MAKKKDFSIGGPPSGPVLTAPAQGALVSTSATVTLPLGDGRVKNYDFTSFLNQGFDDTVFAMADVLRKMVKANHPKPHSLRTIIESGLASWWRFCGESAQRGVAPTLRNLDSSTIEAYVGWLGMQLTPAGERWSKNTARTAYSKTKSILTALAKHKLIGADIFPFNPFPGATALLNRRDYIQPMSARERESILRPLSVEVSQIYDSVHLGTPRHQLGLCAFAIFLKTGLNPTSFFEMPRDLTVCFIPHPRVNRKILVIFKRRAGKDTETPIQPSETKVVSLDVYKLCVRVAEMTTATAQEAGGTGLDTLLWIYRTEDGGTRTLNTEDLSDIANAFTNRHQLIRDDGTRLKMTSQLFRNSKVNRVWRMSKGDLFATARSVSNTPAIANRYLSVSHEMLLEHRLAGEVLVDTLSAKKTTAKTPHSGCSDPLNGELAPKNGKTCVDFLSCFRCKSQVIVEEDLYKLFSFYWALFSQRSRLGADSWKKLFAWITRIIDRDIAPRFQAKVVRYQKERARTNPHPMWRSEGVLAALRSIA